MAETSEGPFKWFVGNCTLYMIQEGIKAYLIERKVYVERTKSAHKKHHAKPAADTIVSFVKQCLAPFISKEISLEKLSVRSFLRGLPSRRPAVDPSIRRTFEEDEIRAMFEACKEVARWSLIMRIMREIVRGYSRGGRTGHRHLKLSTQLAC
jgi:hypothetical protein